MAEWGIEIWIHESEIIVNLSDGRITSGTRHFGPSGRSALRCVERLRAEGYPLRKPESFRQLQARVAIEATKG